MLYKETICPVCSGHGYISGSGEYSIWTKPCTNCQNGVIVVPVTNGDLMRSCSNDQLLQVLINLTHTAIYSGGEHNRLLLSTPEDFLFWLNKATDDLDLRTVFDFIDKKDYEHSWLKAAEAKI
jgi:hypothetical protein